MWQFWPYSKSWKKEKFFSFKAIEKALGRIQWATATCPMAKPFLQPFWAWKSAVKNRRGAGEILAVLLSQLFSKQFPQMSPFSPWSSWTGASDASAEKAGDSLDRRMAHRWFQYKVSQKHHPWAFKQNDPQKENCGPGALRHLVFGTAADGAESFYIL